MLDKNILAVKGVGQKTAALLNKLKITTIEELLKHYPVKYEEYKAPSALDNTAINNISASVCLYGTLTQKITQTVSSKYTISSSLISNQDKSLKVIWYNSQYLAYKLKPLQSYVFIGRIVKRGQEPLLSHPLVYTAEEYKKLLGTFKPVYELTAGLSNNMLIKLIKTVFESPKGIEDYLPEGIKIKYKLISYQRALKQIHAPCSEAEIIEAKKRLAFDDFFLFLYKISLLKNEVSAKGSAYKLYSGSAAESIGLGLISEYLKALPYKFTDSQNKAMEEILYDMAGEKQMHRLIQGDVGSGKTAVAVGAAFAAFSCGFQVAVMAPTEILALQHYQFIISVSAGLKNPPRTALLTGSLTKKEKLKLYQAIQTRNIDIVIGTQALIQEGVSFSKLALVITDEQHRFGVIQRQSLAVKGEEGKEPHVLVMSATPIPRTLALILYGDLDISLINEKPVGRLPIKNAVIASKDRYKAYAHIDKELKRGHQAYIICPLAEESENIEAENLYNYREKLAKSCLKNYNIDVIHGKLKQYDKDEAMRKFINKDTDILISTTVIEVGIDVPNATVIVIEDAQRFGLAALHQLRGRVGRGNFQSYCIFVKTSTARDAEKKLEVVGKSNDGFFIAAQDLKIRGPGELFGLMQSGVAKFSFSEVFNDSEVFDAAKSAVYDISSACIKLNKNEAVCLSEKINRRYGEFNNKIGL